MTKNCSMSSRTFERWSSNFPYPWVIFENKRTEDSQGRKILRGYVARIYENFSLFLGCLPRVPQVANRLCRDDDNYGIVSRGLCPYARRCRIKTTYRPTGVKKEKHARMKAHGNAFLRIISDVYSLVTLHYGNWNSGSKSIRRRLSAIKWLARERELEGNSFNGCLMLSKIQGEKTLSSILERILHVSAS